MVKVLVLAGGTDESRLTAKEATLMRRLLLVLTVALVMAAMVVVTAAPAFADKGEGGHIFNCGGVLCGSAGGGTGGVGGSEGAIFQITTPPSDPASTTPPNITS